MNMIAQLTSDELDALRTSSLAMAQNTLPIFDSSRLIDWFEYIWNPEHQHILRQKPREQMSSPRMPRKGEGIGLPAANAPTGTPLPGKYHVIIATTFADHMRELNHSDRSKARDAALHLCLTSIQGVAKIAQPVIGYDETVWVYQQNEYRLMFQLIAERKQLVLLSYRVISPTASLVERNKAVPYTAEISRSNPSCMLFLIDQSGSMDEKLKNGKTKAQSLADAINRMLYELIVRSTKSDGVRNFYEVGVIGYGRSVGPAFIGELKNKPLVPLSVLADNPAKVETRQKQVEDDSGGKYVEDVRFLVWIEPVQQGGTPMGEALHYACSVLQPWVEQHPNAFPPIVINITDGEANDHSESYAPTREAEELRKLSTDDGGVLLFNLQLGSSGRKVQFPEQVGEIKNQYAQQLFTMSSPLPDYMRDALERAEYDVGSASRGFVYNADMLEVITFLEIGTRPRVERADR